MILLSDLNDNMITSESLIQAGIILIIAIAIILTNILVIATLFNFKGTSEVINCYLLSLAVADLLCGLLVVPLSVYPAMVHYWVYESSVCQLVSYLEAILWIVTVYTFMWISVDRYLAVRKPLRYETLQTKTKSQCLVAFIWISAVMLCFPLNFHQPLFDIDSHICILDWGRMAAYSMILSILVLGSSLITIIYTYRYIFSMLRKLGSVHPSLINKYTTALNRNLSDPSHMMSFTMIIAFWMSWTPYFGVKLYEYFNGVTLQIQFLHFGIVWLGFLNSFWKPIILITMNPQFRLALKTFCKTIFCCNKGRLQAELI